MFERWWVKSTLCFGINLWKLDTISAVLFSDGNVYSSLHFFSTCRMEISMAKARFYSSMIFPRPFWLCLIPETAPPAPANTSLQRKVIDSGDVAVCNRIINSSGFLRISVTFCSHICPDLASDFTNFLASTISALAMFHHLDYLEVFHWSFRV